MIKIKGLEEKVLVDGKQVGEVTISTKKPTTEGWKKIPYSMALPLSYKKGEGFYDSSNELLTPKQVVEKINEYHGWRLHIVNPKKVVIIPLDGGLVDIYYVPKQIKGNT